MSIAVAIQEPTLAAQGTCFGYRVRSDLEFIALRGGQGEALEIVEADDIATVGGELAFDWVTPTFHAQIYADDGRFRYWVRGFGWFEIDPERTRIRVPRNVNPVLREELVWGIPAMLLFRARGDVPLHAAAVELGGGAVLLAAPGRFGKSTLAAAFLRRGYRVLSEDVCCLRPGKPMRLVPGPATVRLRRDVGSVLELASTPRVARVGSRVRYVPERPGDCAPVPVRGLVFLARSDDGVHAEPLQTDRVIPNIWRLSFRLRETDAARCFSVAAELANSVPAWTLRRPLQLDHLDEAVDRILDCFAET